ncbi:hypothetical protein J437_LFUL008168 [Ladona fulva]|uniref:NADH dehydrogenase [ubiquinone] 1 beta subcomplex subunit 2, mitochondrial n=1 Tax=Ladona fulva TaxID=123851 RepID=A0A8K0KNR8_LADFU|nr:hypothetical protein J437_LFUL008168 [Ladona fulva]
MLISRGGIMLRRVLSCKNKFAVNNVAIGGSRNSGGSWAYRSAVPNYSKENWILAEFVGGFMWWWVLWHLWHDYEHITGEFPYPDPTKWTDAELGIPPDDEE